MIEKEKATISECISPGQADKLRHKEDEIDSLLKINISISTLPSYPSKGGGGVLKILYPTLFYQYNTDKDY